MIPDNVTLAQSGRYTNPANDTSGLPMVYGDLTDGNVGIWVCPHIDTVNHVYAFAGHETLSVANGNSVNIYVDGVLASPQPTFNESDNYEGQGVISSLTFASAQTGDVTARGKGKPTASSGSTLMENPIDVIADILDFAGFNDIYFDTTAKAKSRQDSISQGYDAAGVITQSVKTWDVIQDILNTFNTPKTQVFISGDGLLVLRIDVSTFTVSSEYTTMPKRHTRFINAEQRLEDIINTVKGRYRYNYVHDQYYSETQDFTDAKSINIHGDQNASYSFPWTRNSSNVNSVLNLILDEFKDSRWFAQVDDITLDRLNLDIGDSVVATLEDLYDSNGDKMINQFWIIQAFNPNERKISMQLLDTGKFLESPAIYNGDYDYDGTIEYGGDRNLTEF
jgi:hypothetical protein